MTILTLPTNDADWLDDDELIDEMLATWKATPASRRNARYTLRGFAAWCRSHHTTLQAVTAADCRAWLAERDEVQTAKSCAKNWSQLVAFYKVAERHTSDPLGGRRSPMCDVPQPAFPEWVKTHAATEAEYHALCQQLAAGSIGLRDRIALSLMFRSGLRVGETTKLDVADLDVAARTVRVVWGKNNKPRLVPLHPETLELLRRYLNPRRRGEQPGPLLVNVGPRRASARLTVNAAQNVVKRAAAKAGVDVSPHALRRGAVVAFYTGGGDDTAAMTIFGWDTPTMPGRYLADARAAVAQITFDRVVEATTPRSREQRVLRSMRAG